MDDNESLTILKTVCNRLSVIEERLLSLQGTHELLQEIIRHDLYQLQYRDTTPQHSSTSSFFHVTLFTDSDTNDPLYFQVSGKTYDIRDRLKSFGNPSFIKDNKAWQYNYEENTYRNVVQYLRTVSNEIREDTLSVPVP